jgi:mono/diheme cytochrome c family protein
MDRSGSAAGRVRYWVPILAVMATAGLLAAFRAPAPEPNVDPDQILRGRQLVLEHACGECHGGGSNPAAEGWLAGMTEPEQEFRIGPGCAEGAEGDCFLTRPRNLTPDNITGMGRFSERQIFNAMRYGLRPGETADVEITATEPGVGNFPENPKFLAPPMPWPAWRYMSDDELWAIAAYLKHGLKPVRNRVADSEGPPDFWASAYGERLPPMPPAPFPTANEAEPQSGADRETVLRGRQLVIQHDCGGCHGGGVDPSADGWLAGSTGPGDDFPIGEFMLRPKNLTPDEDTGIGRYTDRQLFNALRHGLQPASAPDAKITSTEPGVGGFPAEPRYLGPGMPWSSWRHMSDDDIRAVIAYLRHGLAPVQHEVADSDAPPDFWAEASSEAEIGPWPAAPFPTEYEVGG